MHSNHCVASANHLNDTIVERICISRLSFREVTSRSVAAAMFILMLLKSIDDDDGDDDEYAMKDLAFLRGLSGSAWCFG